LRLAFRLPIYLYRLDLGWLLGHRFLLLVHRGRESGRSLADIGCRSEADAFRSFIERSSAGGAKDLQIMYGVGGERRLVEVYLDHLEGYRGARPVRVGNAASNQLQLDVHGELVEQTWRWHQRGRSPDDDYWRFLLGIIETAAERWREPDRGLWEMRGEPRHFVHSKVMCWAALDRGVRLAEECLRKAPVKRWGKIRDEIREAIESEGYDDERMVRTVDTVREELDAGGLLLRYRPSKGTEGHLEGKEGAFLPCSFWLAECLARKGRIEDAREVFDRTVSTGNKLALFSEEYDPQSDQALGNFPQALTHLSHITAAVALFEHREYPR